jgi:putative aminopeptidase FrvX
MPLPRVLKDVLSLPTGTFVEQAILKYVQSTCSGLPGVTCTTDRYGNILAHYRRKPPAVMPLIFAGHSDHPGFVAQEMVDRRTVRAAFRGGVSSSYVERAKVRFWSRGHWINAKVRELTRTVDAPRFGRGATRPEEGLLTVSEPVEPNSPGMWDLAGPALDGDIVRGVACDDLAGVAAMLELLRRLSGKQARGEVYCLFTRAEEVGFIGAIGAAEARTVPKKLPIVAIETSKELPNAPLGAGPILRVGDRMSVFTPELTAWCGQVAQKLAARRRSFKFQRKLMDGGTCESTAYVAYGYQATGLCLSLGNYHNMNEKSGKLDSEYISLADWRSLVDWFEALVLERDGFAAADSKSRVRAELAKGFRSRVELLATDSRRKQTM